MVKIAQLGSGTAVTGTLDAGENGTPAGEGGWGGRKERGGKKMPKWTKMTASTCPKEYLLLQDAEHTPATRPSRFTARSGPRTTQPPIHAKTCVGVFIAASFKVETA